MSRNNLKKFLQYIPAFSPGALSKITGQKLLLPVYHSLETEYQPHIENLYQLRDERLFKKDMDYLLKHYQPVQLEDIIAHVRGEKHIKNPSFFITFDDGLSEVLDIALPILQNKGIPAAIFVNPDFVDNKDLMYRYKASLLVSHIKKGRYQKEQIAATATLLSVEPLEAAINKQLLKINYRQKQVLDEIAGILNYSFTAFAERHKPYLSLEDLKEIRDDGFYIGGHTMDHPELEQLSMEEQQQQIIKSVHWVKEQLNLPYSIFAFPFTDTFISKEIFSHIEKGIDLSFGSAGIKKDKIPYNLQRLPMEGTTVPAANILKAEYLYYLLKQPLFKNKMKRI